MVFSNANTYSGGTTVSAGILRLAQGGSLVGNVSISSGATLEFAQTSNITYAGNLTGTGTVAFTGGARYTLTGSHGLVSGTWLINNAHILEQVSTSFGLNSGTSLSFNGGTYEWEHPSHVFQIGYTSNVQRRVFLGAGGGTFKSNVGVFDNWVLTGTGNLTLINTRTDEDNFYQIRVIAQDNRTAGATIVQQGGLRIASTDFLKEATSLQINAGSYVDLIATNAVAYKTGSLSGAGSLNLGDDSLEFGALNTVTTFSGIISGTGSLIKAGSNATTLSGASSYSGGTTVSAGTLLVNNTSGSGLGTGAVTVNSGATLGGSGYITGIVTVGNGGILSPGNSPGVLTLGELILNDTSILNFELGTVSDRVDVVQNLNGTTSSGNLTLDGILNITAGTGFGDGTYTLFNYDGTLTNNVLSFGARPTGYTLSIDVDTTNNQVLLLVSAGGLLYWDGAGPGNNSVVNGGDGNWNAGNTNWTDVDGVTNGAWTAGYTPVFSGTAGTVNVTENVNVRGMQFATTGYTIAGNGGNINLVGTTNEFTLNPSVTGTVSANITGTGGLVKNGLGTLVLSGTNTYTGGTAINAGTLRFTSNGNLGNVSGGLTFNGGILDWTPSGYIQITRAATLNAGGGTLQVSNLGGTMSYNGVISGSGSLTTLGALILTAQNTYTGGTNIHASTVSFSSDGNLGHVNGTVSLDNASALLATETLTTNRSTTLNAGGGRLGTFTNLTFTHNGVISGTGSLSTVYSGTLVLGGVNTYTGGTVLNGGIVQISSNANLGNNSGGLTFNGGTLHATANMTIGRATTLNSGTGTLQVSDSVYLLHQGLISGSGGLRILGASQNSTVELTATNAYTGGTLVENASLLITSDANLGATSGALALTNGRLYSLTNFSTNRTTVLTGTGTLGTTATYTITHSGVISGTGALVKNGAGKLNLTKACFKIGLFDVYVR